MTGAVSTPARILFVDDDADVRKAADVLLRRAGFELFAASTPREAWSVLAATEIDVVLLDLNFGPGATSGAEGLRCLQDLIARDRDAVVVVVTGHSGLTVAVAAMRAGAADFVMKPWNNDRLVATLNDAVARHRRRRAARVADAPPPAAQDLHLVGDSPAMRQVQQLAARVAPTNAAVLLLGEAGTGKSMLARVLHHTSARAARALVTLDPAGIWREGEAALHAALAAIDAEDTLLLDEIGGLPARPQALLTGWIADHPAARLIAASRHPAAALQAGLATADLLDRLGTIQITLPPLRDRGDDIATLARHFLRVAALRHARPHVTLSEQAVGAIATACWPGNVRELRQAIERAVVLSHDAVLRAEDILPLVPPEASAASALPGAADLNLERSERAVVQAALRRHGFNVTRAARDLGLTRAALYRRMARHGF